MKIQITESEVRRIMNRVNYEGKSANIRAFVQSFNEYAPQFGIDTKLRAAHYIAQVAHETLELRYSEEIASGQQYEGRRDLGNTQPGDGRRFKGRGYLQTTGRANYQAYQDSGFCQGDLMSHPEWLAKQPGCQKSSMFFWLRRGLNKFADRDDVQTVSRRINGGTNGLAQRMYYWRVAKRVFGINNI